MYRSKPGLTPIERVLSRTEFTDGCWNWTGYKCERGYGILGVDRTPTKTHRISYEAHVGPIPAGMYVLHRCDNRLCLNPAHLFLGTHKDNMRDMVQKRRSASGERNGNAISLAQAAELKALIESRVKSQKAISEETGISQSTLTSIKLGKHWSMKSNARGVGHVPGGETRYECA